MKIPKSKLEPIIDLLYWEQSFNFHSSFRAIRKQALQSSLPVTVDLPVVFLNKEDVDLCRIPDCHADIENWFYEGDKFTFPVHVDNGSTGECMKKKMYYTSSSRTLVPVDTPIFAIKLHRPNRHDFIAWKDIRHAVWVSQRLARFEIDDCLFFLEPMGGITCFQGFPIGFICRHLLPYPADENQLNLQIRPFFQLFESSFFATIDDPESYFFRLVQKIFKSYLGLISKGVIPSPHSQNMLVFEDFDNHTPKPIYKDLNGFYLDLFFWKGGLVPDYVQRVEVEEAIAFRGFTFDVKLGNLLLKPLIKSFSGFSRIFQSQLEAKVRDCWLSIYQPRLPRNYFPKTVFYPDERLYKTQQVIKLCDTNKKPLFR